MKVAIVTGASSGMGKVMVYRLVDYFEELEEIWVIARRADRLTEFIGKMPAKVRILPLDLSKEESITALQIELAEQKPDVKVLVNAAGYGKVGNVGEVSAKDSLGMIQLNDKALVAVTEAVLPYISDDSKIINFASAAAFVPQPGFAVYAATKAFVLSYSRALAMELKKRNITVTAVCPGPVETEFFDIALEGKTMGLLKRITTVKSEPVVNCAIKDSIKGKDICIPSLPMKIVYVLCRLLPHGIIMKIMTW